MAVGRRPAESERVADADGEAPRHDHLRRALDLDPGTAEAHAVLARILVHFDWNAEASDQSARHALELSETNRDMVASLRAAAHGGGLEEFWQVRLQYLHEPHVRPAAVAMAYVRTGDHDRAMEWLDRLYADRGAWITGLNVQPVWDPLRSDSRFQDLPRRANIASDRLPLVSLVACTD